MLENIFSAVFKKSESLTVEQVPELLTDKNTVLLDVRESHEFSSGHIKEAKNVPLSQLELFKPEANKTYLVICQSGMRSLRATNYLKQAGYKAVNIRGGMNSWRGPIVY